MTGRGHDYAPDIAVESEVLSTMSKKFELWYSLPMAQGKALPPLEQWSPMSQEKGGCGSFCSDHRHLDSPFLVDSKPSLFN